MTIAELKFHPPAAKRDKGLDLCHVCGGAVSAKGLCATHYHLEWRRRNPERRKQIANSWYARHKKQAATSSKRWKKENKEKNAASAVRLRRSKLRQYLSYEAAYREANREVIRSKRKADPRTPIRDAVKQAQRRGAEGKYSLQDILSLHRKQRGRCAVCGENLMQYHKDHIMPLKRGGSNSILNIQLLCPECNLSKKDKHPGDFMQSRGFLL